MFDEMVDGREKGFGGRWFTLGCMSVEVSMQGDLRCKVEMEISRFKPRGFGRLV
jgi:hypothetical protein